MPVFDIICLANSRKLTGRCVAGLRTDGQGWIRPVANNSDGTLICSHYILDDGTEARPLDIMRVSFLSPRPEPHQPENWLFENKPWRLLKRPSPQKILPILRAYLINGPTLLGNQSDRIAFDTFEKAGAKASLALVVPEKLQWYITTSFRGRRQTRALFELKGARYDLVIADPVWEQRLSELTPGRHPLAAATLKADDTVLLTISVGEPLEGCCYKLVAAVIVLPNTKNL